MPILDADNKNEIISSTVIFEINALHSPVLVEALPALLEVLDVQPVVDLLELLPGDVADEVPALDVVGVVALQLHHRGVGALFELLVLVKPKVR